MEYDAKWSESKLLLGASSNDAAGEFTVPLEYNTFAYPGCGLDFRSFQHLAKAKTYVFCDPAPVTIAEDIRAAFEMWSNQLREDFSFLSFNSSHFIRLDRITGAIRLATESDFSSITVEDYEITSDFALGMHFRHINGDETTDLIFIADRWEHYEYYTREPMSSAPQFPLLPAVFDCIYEHKSNISLDLLGKYAVNGTHLIWGLPPNAPEIQVRK